MIVPVTEKNLSDAARVHTLSWQDSHKAFCTPEFLAKHTIVHQTAYLKKEAEQGKQVFLLLEEEPIGVVSVWNNLIENLYVLPEKQRQGYGTKLLLFAMAKCSGTPSLWILENNRIAFDLYTAHGFQKTGKVHILSESISEVEMELRNSTGIDPAQG